MRQWTIGTFAGMAATLLAMPATAQGLLRIVTALEGSPMHQLGSAIADVIFASPLDRS